MDKEWRRRAMKREQKRNTEIKDEGRISKMKR